VGVHDGLQSDAELIRASVADPQLFRALFERHFASTFRYFARRLGRAAADDLTAEVFLRAFEKRGSYDLSYESARPWLFGIAANLLRRSRRKEERRLRALAKQPAEVPGAGDEGATGDARLDYEATRPVLARALTSLRADEREVLLLVAWADLSYEEVGRALAIPVGTVRSRLHRARGHMRTVLEREYPNDPRDPAPETVAVKEDVRWMTSN
jgi:RNA polymerase sigma-70 factor (ECF subfamily)